MESYMPDLTPAVIQVTELPLLQLKKELLLQVQVLLNTSPDSAQQTLE